MKTSARLPVLFRAAPWLLLLLALPARAAGTISISIDGIDEPLRRNVLLYLSIAQQKSDVYSFTAPLDSLNSNWAYMVMASLAWSLKAWAALLLPEEGRWQEKHREEKHKLLRMDFTTFRRALVNIPAQIIRTGGKILYRLLAWNPWQHVFFRLLDQLRRPLRC